MRGTYCDYRRNDVPVRLPTVDENPTACGGQTPGGCGNTARRCGPRAQGQDPAFPGAEGKISHQDGGNRSVRENTSADRGVREDHTGRPARPRLPGPKRVRGRISVPADTRRTRGAAFAADCGSQGYRRISEAVGYRTATFTGGLDADPTLTIRSWAPDGRLARDWKFT